MTVSSVVVRAVAGWSGAETEFPTGIQVLTKSQLVVSLVPDEGARLPLTLGLHYAVNLSPAGVATVLPLPAFPAAHGEVSFVRRTPMTQDYDPTATDTYDAAGHAAALDRSAMRVAELSQAVDDIAAASVVVEGGAASVPVGAVYVSDGAGKAVAGPTVAQIGQAEGWAGDAKQSAKAAADSARAAALFDPSSYSTTAQINTMLGDYVPKTVQIKASGGGLSVNTVGAGSAALAGDVTLNVVYATQAEAEAGALTYKVMNPLRVAQAIAALAPNRGYTDVSYLNTSGNFTFPADLDTAVDPLVFVFGAGGGAPNASWTGGGGGVAVGTVTAAASEVAAATVGVSVLTGTSGSSSFKGLTATGGGAATGSANGANGVGSGGNIGNTTAATMQLSGLYYAGQRELAFALSGLTVAKRTAFTGPLFFYNTFGNYVAQTPWTPDTTDIPGIRAGGLANRYGAGGAVIIFYKRKGA